MMKQETTVQETTVQETTVQVARFDLMDIENEPSDEQLESLMAAVAAEARRKREVAYAAFWKRMDENMASASARWKTQNLKSPA